MSTDVRDWITAHLAGRGWDPDLCWTTPIGTSHWRGPREVIVTAGGGEVNVSASHALRLIVPATAPDLLARLGETLDRLGV